MFTLNTRLCWRSHLRMSVMSISWFGPPSTRLHYQALPLCPTTHLCLTFRLHCLSCRSVAGLWLWRDVLISDVKGLVAIRASTLSPASRALKGDKGSGINGGLRVWPTPTKQKSTNISPAACTARSWELVSSALCSPFLRHRSLRLRVWKTIQKIRRFGSTMYIMFRVMFPGSNMDWIGGLPCNNHSFEGT